MRDRAGKDKRDAKGGVSWDAGENECKRRTVWVEKRERASADAEDESSKEWFERNKTFCVLVQVEHLSFSVQLISVIFIYLNK